MDSKPAVDNVKWTRGGRYIATTFRHVIPTLEPGDQGDRGIILELQTDLRDDINIMEKAPTTLGPSFGRKCLEALSHSIMALC